MRDVTELQEWETLLETFTTRQSCWNRHFSCNF